MLLELGHRLAVRHGSRESEEQRGGLGTIEGAVFALFGLLLAFTFSGAASRFNEKRMLIAEESNAIGTAYFRLNLLPPESRKSLVNLFQQYVDSRVATYRLLPDLSAASREMAYSRKLQEQIWMEALAATRRPEAHADAAKLLLPSLNTMFDIMTIRTMALNIHPPRIIYDLLLWLGLLCSVLAGYRMPSRQHRSWLHIFVFAVITTIVIYVILDLEYPRAGLIRIETGDQFLVDLRTSMN